MRVSILVLFSFLMFVFRIRLDLFEKKGEGKAGTFHRRWGDDARTLFKLRRPSPKTRVLFSLCFAFLSSPLQVMKDVTKRSLRERAVVATPSLLQF